MALDLESVNSRTLSYERLVSQLNETGRAVILVPMGLLFSTGTEQKFRKKLFDAGWIEAIVGLPAGAVAPYTGVQSALLLINKQKKEKEFLVVDSSEMWQKFPRMPYKTLSDSDLWEIVRLVHGRIEKEGISKIISFDDDSDYNFTPSFYINPFEVGEIKVKDVRELLLNEKQLMERLDEINQELSSIRCS
jgi:type I restriction-modification system DNA methylase subunit